MLIPNNYKMINFIYSSKKDMLDVEQIRRFARRNPTLVHYLPKKVQELPGIAEIIRKRDGLQFAQELEAALIKASASAFDDTVQRYRSRMKFPANRQERRLKRKEHK